MSGYWQQTGTTSITLTAPAGAAAGGEQIRIRSIVASVASAAALTVTDSVAGVIWQFTGTQIALAGLDIRGSVGGNLTIALASGTAIDVAGDYVPQGYPYGLT